MEYFFLASQLGDQACARRVEYISLILDAATHFYFSNPVSKLYRVGSCCNFVIGDVTFITNL